MISAFGGKNNWPNEKQQLATGEIGQDAILECQIMLTVNTTFFALGLLLSVLTYLLSEGSHLFLLLTLFGCGKCRRDFVLKVEMRFRGKLN